MIRDQVKSRIWHDFKSSWLGFSHNLQPCTASFPWVSISILSRLLSSPQSSTPFPRSLYFSIDPFSFYHSDLCFPSTIVFSTVNSSSLLRIPVFSVLFVSTKVAHLFSLLPPLVPELHNFHISKLWNPKDFANFLKTSLIDCLWKVRWLDS